MSRLSRPELGLQSTRPQVKLSQSQLVPNANQTLALTLNLTVILTLTLTTTQTLTQTLTLTSCLQKQTLSQPIVKIRALHKSESHHTAGLILTDFQLCASTKL